MIIRVYRPSYISSFSPFVFARLDPRSLFTYSLIFSLFTQLCHDILIYYLKYQEGYVYAKDPTRHVNETLPKTFYYDIININYEDDAVIENPKSNWNKQDLDYSEVAYYLNAVSMGFMFYGNSCTSDVILVLCLLSIRTQFGITTLITSPTRSIILTQNCDQLKIFQDFNLWLICSLFIWNVASLLLSIDTIFMQPNVYPDFNVGSVNTGVVTLQRSISSPYNVTKPKTFNYDIDNLHELKFDCSSSSCSDDTSSRNSHTKSFHSKHSITSTSHLRHSSLKKKGLNKLKSHRTSHGKIAKNNIGKRKNKEMKTLPTNEISSSSLPISMTLIGNNAIEEILEQQIMVETRQDVIIEPAYMHAYINPHIPSPRYERTPISGGSRTDSIATDLLLAPLPSPYSEFAVTSTRRIGKRNSFNKQQSSLKGNGTPDINRNSISSYENNNISLKSTPTDDNFNDKNEQIITTDNLRRAIGSGLRNSVVSSYYGDASGISEDEIIRSGSNEKRIERRSSRKKQTMG
ncbi:8855_t:CDS:2 [Diversispora eburnea]|uniref:8855_t:CDS:1 n=1 Tax=Diversispora eburnea TaxID=1213867 RepID=A0A9N8VY95_9GLOM|nr:8855_t:CDS:2 [Diversispora eburnea]